MKIFVTLLLICCINTFVQAVGISKGSYLNAQDSLLLHIKGCVFDANTNEYIPFVKVSWNSFHTETDLDGNYELEIPISAVKSMKKDTVSITFQLPSYCIPTINIGITKLIQLVNNKGTLCGVQINGEPFLKQQELIIEK